MAFSWITSLLSPFLFIAPDFVVGLGAVAVEVAEICTSRGLGAAFLQELLRTIASKE